MHKQTKATAIPADIKARVARRDCSGGQIATCIICGAPGGPHCHVVRRSQGGMGVEENIVALCGPCHYAFDEGYGIKRLEPLGFRSQQEIKEYIYADMESHYPGWTPADVTYHNWGPQRRAE